jgi:hypothetical protein
MDNERLKKEVVTLKLQLADRSAEQSNHNDRHAFEEEMDRLREEVQLLRKQVGHHTPFNHSGSHGRNHHCRPISTAVRQPPSTPGFSPPSRACRGRTARSLPARSARTQTQTAHASKCSRAPRPVQAVRFSFPVSERPRRPPWFRLLRHAGCASPRRNVSAEPSTRPKPRLAPKAKLKVSTSNPYYLRPTSTIVPPSTTRVVYAREASSARAKPSPATTRAR